METREFSGFFVYEEKAVISLNGRLESFATVLPSNVKLSYLDTMRQWTGIRRFGYAFTVLLMLGCSDEERGEQDLAASSFEQTEKIARLSRTNEDLAWEVERLKLKVNTVSGEDMVLLKKKETELWHYDLEVKPYTGRAVNKFEDGSLKHDASFFQGKKDGVERYWHPNGQVREERMWMEGKYHGFVTEWDAEGNIVSRKRFQRGKKVPVQ